MIGRKSTQNLTGPIVTDDEIVGTANAILATYGKNALTEARSHAEVMKKLGDNHSFETWSRIAAAIESRSVFNGPY